jgi:hypothetical protein
MDVHAFVYSQIHMPEIYYTKATFDPAPLFANKSDIIRRHWSSYSIDMLMATMPFNGKFILLARVIYIP